MQNLAWCLARGKFLIKKYSNKGMQNINSPYYSVRTCFSTLSRVEAENSHSCGCPIRTPQIPGRVQLGPFSTNSECKSPGRLRSMYWGWSFCISGVHGVYEKERKMGSELLADRTLGARKAEKGSRTKPSQGAVRVRARQALQCQHSMWAPPQFRGSVPQSHRQPWLGFKVPLSLAFQAFP